MNYLLLCLFLCCWKATYCRAMYGKKFITPKSIRQVDKMDDSFKQVKVFYKVGDRFVPLENVPNKHENLVNIDTKYEVDRSVDPETNIEPNNLSMEIGKYSIKASSILHKQDKEYIIKDSKLVPISKFHHIIEISSNNEDGIEDEFDFKETSVVGLTEDSRMFSNDLLEVPVSVDLSRNSPENIADVKNIQDEDHSSIFEFQSSGEGEFASSDPEIERSGKILSIFSRDNDTVLCTTPKNESGICRRFRDCLLSNVLNSFNNFLQYLCLIRGALVGVCCPDNPVIEVTDSESSENDDVEVKQPPEGCGLNTKTRIVGGTVSVPHEWSWMVALMRRNRFYCGGVVINNWYILTAAHCVLGVDVKDLSVRLGEYNFNERNKHQEDFSIAEIKRHAQFITLTFQHDIALLKLKRSIKYSKFVGSICLPTEKARNYSEANGTVVGWGTVSFGGAASPILRQVTVPVWENEDCNRIYSMENIGNSFLCAGNPKKGEDACQGDSGGPLMTLSNEGRWEVIGIVSWGRKCGDPTYPGVYTRITTYLDWIKLNAV